MGQLLPDNQALLWLENTHARVGIAPALGGALVCAEAQVNNRPVPLFRPWVGSDSGVLGVAQNLLLPFSNRLSGGGFSYAGVFHAVAANLPGEPCPIHGDAFQRTWQLVAKAEDHIRLQLANGHIGPFDYGAEVTYELQKNTLVSSLQVINRGIELPFGGGFHPWFRRDSSTEVCFKSTGIWLEDAQHLPTSHLPVDASPFSGFDRCRTLPAQLINNAFTGWNGLATIRQPANGVEITIRCGPPLDTLIIYSPDEHANFFCLEPVSHSVDAHNQSGTQGLVALASGETFQLSMTMSWSACPSEA
jgi:aldose 1-epimerase